MDAAIAEMEALLDGDPAEVWRPVRLFDIDDDPINRGFNPRSCLRHVRVALDAMKVARRAVEAIPEPGEYKPR